MNSSSIVRRTDLTFRGHYPDIETEIYRIAEDNYVIFCKCDDTRFQDLKNSFDYKIKPITTPVELSNIFPVNHVEKIPPISDREISKNFEGMLMSETDMLNILAGKFPEVHFSRIELVTPKEVRIYTGAFEEIIDKSLHYRFLSVANEKKVLDFLNNLKMPFAFSIQDEKVKTKPDLVRNGSINPIQYLLSPRLMKGPVVEFAQRDEAIWYDNIDRIYAGEFEKDNLFFHKSKEFTCYADFSGFGNVDLRNFLFLFQCAYLTLPYEKDLVSWLSDQKITEEEFMDLIRKNRIKIVLLQPEFRYDIAFMQRVYRVNPNAVISRRALQTLVLTDIVSISDKYLLNGNEIFSKIRPFAEAASALLNTPADYLYDVMTWPIQARRRAFEHLQYGAPFSIGSFGINNVVQKNYSKLLNRDVSFEFTISASAIHIANALNATYFPIVSKGGFTDYFYASIMGDMLNLYQHSSQGTITDYIEGKKKFSDRTLLINPIDLIELNEYVSITELESVLSYQSIMPGSQRLMETLANLDPMDRRKKIAEYNLAVENKLSGMVSRHAMDLAQNVAVDLIGYGSGNPWAGSIYWLLKAGGNKIKKVMHPVLHKVEESLHEHNVDEANIHFLSKINRVAKLKDRSKAK